LRRIFGPMNENKAWRIRYNNGEFDMSWHEPHGTPLATDMDVTAQQIAKILVWGFQGGDVV
jgi:hypothetical protein